MKFFFLSSNRLSDILVKIKNKIKKKRFLGGGGEGNQLTPDLLEKKITKMSAPCDDFDR